jgi:hypothetical protein
MAASLTGVAICIALMLPPAPRPVGHEQAAGGTGKGAVGVDGSGPLEPSGREENARGALHERLLPA